MHNESLRNISVGSVGAIKLKGIKDYLDMKYNADGTISDAYRNWQNLDDDRWYDCELDYVNGEGRLVTAYIHDVTYTIDKETEEEGEVHELVVYISLPGKYPIKLRKRCIAPIGCELDWSKVLCAYDVI